VHDELVLVDQSKLGQRQRELHASHEQPIAWLLLEAPHFRLQMIPAHKLRVPVHMAEGARHNVFLRRVDRPGERLHPIGHPLGPCSRPRQRPPGGLNHFVRHPAKDEGVSLREALGRTTMQLLIRDHRAMIAASIQCDVDRIPKGSHSASVPRSRLDRKF
jgi:hypothetical protein